MSGPTQERPQDLDRHILRRETHSARSGAAVIAAFVVAVAALYFMLESMLAALGQPTWLASPGMMLQWIADLPGDTPRALLAAAGVLLALFGLIFLCHGILPGRRARHIISHPRVAIVVDDEVVASALAKTARVAAGVTREQVMVVVSARQVQVNVRPTSGIPLSESQIQGAVEAQVADMGLNPVPSVSVKLADSGVIGV
ncbi:hypothetical protein AS189_03560 [Arthrobacter alpinus]|uniref:DNA/RNA endonuclease G n=1 Tax=Arthrobacter alpinus TaxID=656366 RepID=A0A0S2LWW5_9MICC|nr:DUF6286 domain-containing protein [Arthrobacter alpinus]ALO65735.1 hypothetical protein AS189_03560 [Arthrobacter alpinus]